MRIVTLISLLCCATLAGSQPAAKPQDISSLLEQIRESHDLPALAGAIVTSDGLRAVGVTGVRKYDSPERVTLDDQFHLGSDTKAMTATLLATFVDEGKLSWSTTLAQVFPELAADMDPAYQRATIETLLAQRAGLSGESWPRGKTFGDMHSLPGSPRQQRMQYLKMILREPPSHPGAFEYSNRNYAVAGAIAEKIADKGWEELMEERIFRPLHMSTCGFGAMGTPGKVDQPWQHRVVNGTHMAIAPGPHADNPPVIAPAGTVHCSIGDWAKFIQAHLRGERGFSGIVKPATFRRMHTAVPGGEYGYGWFVVQRPWAGGRALNHNGSNNQNYAVTWIAPDRDFAVLVATNQADAGEDTFKACDDAAGALIRKASAQ